MGAMHRDIFIIASSWSFDVSSMVSQPAEPRIKASPTAGMTRVSFLIASSFCRYRIQEPNNRGAAETPLVETPRRERRIDRSIASHAINDTDPKLRAPCGQGPLSVIW
jgi:hypothetical protein